jgi:hypothetical protein
MDEDLLRGLCEKAGIKLIGNSWVLTTMSSLSVLAGLIAEHPRCVKCGSLNVIESKLGDRKWLGCGDCDEMWEI